jgi:hypothetical protein
MRRRVGIPQATTDGTDQQSRKRTATKECTTQASRRQAALVLLGLMVTITVASCARLENAAVAPSAGASQKCSEMTAASQPASRVGPTPLPPSFYPVPELYAAPVSFGSGAFQLALPPQYVTPRVSLGKAYDTLLQAQPGAATYSKSAEFGMFTALGRGDIQSNGSVLPTAVKVPAWIIIMNNVPFVSMLPHQSTGQTRNEVVVISSDTGSQIGEFFADVDPCLMTGGPSTDPPNAPAIKVSAEAKYRSSMASTQKSR